MKVIPKNELIFLLNHVEDEEMFEDYIRTAFKNYGDDWFYGANYETGRTGWDKTRTNEKRQKELERLDYSKCPHIEFIPLKEGLTNEELYDCLDGCDSDVLVYLRCKYDYETEWEYLVEGATWSIDGIIWLNDWYEGQQQVEYLAITVAKENKHEQ